MKPDEYYQKQIDHYTARLKQIKKRRNLITLAKLLTFGYMIFLIYLLINHSTQPLLLLGIGAILVFIFLTLWDSQIIYRQHLIEELLRINTLESDYLAGNFSALDQGERFNDPAHPYAHDLDLFGEDSLFQHLNRTVTFSGTQKLVSWLLSLSKDPEVIHSSASGRRIMRRTGMVSTLSCCRSTPSDPSPRCGHFKIRTDRIPILFKT